VNAQFAESFGLDRPHGALVSSVESDGPGDKAGLKSGDVILEVNGAPIEHSWTLPTVISRIKPGTTAQLTVWRGGKRSNMSIKVGEFTEGDTRTAAKGGAAPPGANQAPQLGLAVRLLQPEEKEQAQTEGSLVVERSSGPAASGGVRPGDIILGVNGQKVKSVAELQTATKKAGSTVALLIQRGDAQIFVPIRVSSGNKGPG
jgi:serine protease Do